MKKYIFLFFAVSNSVAFEQSKTVCRSVTNDGNALSIHMSGNIDGEDFNFDHTFDISSLDKIARLVFKDKILDSLDVFIAEIPEKPTFPKVSKAAKPSKADKSEVVVNMEETATSDNQIKNLSSATQKSFSKEVRYNSECGELFLRYKYEKGGEEYEYERTINAKNKSKSERMHIIEETERELGLTTIQ
ncbi:hypothetical protein L0657_02815 [Dyadobacter sp. CY345]|uniref:hypothetical protein n=1 Tax=Dyadobacter sp. CY345 TaxID=2909335 RepID=UPI001F224651|nr:hypothetical protein [Dyadobacter sp. CY345]MCF2442874.1 hypothetical protein [Dyadobacter sp. CY345]